MLRLWQRNCRGLRCAVVSGRRSPLSVEEHSGRMISSWLSAQRHKRIREFIHRLDERSPRLVEIVQSHLAVSRLDQLRNPCHAGVVVLQNRIETETRLESVQAGAYISDAVSHLGFV